MRSTPDETKFDFFFGVNVSKQNIAPRADSFSFLVKARTEIELKERNYKNKILKTCFKISPASLRRLILRPSRIWTVYSVMRS